MFFKDGKSTALLNVFAEGVQFYWQVRREGLEFKRQVTPTLYPQEGYHFKMVHDLLADYGFSIHH